MNNVMEYKGYYGSVEYSPTDNILFGKIIGINSLISYEGDSVQTLKQDFQEAVDDYLDMCSEQGVEPEKVYRGSFNIRISPDLHRKISLYAGCQKVFSQLRCRTGLTATGERIIRDSASCQSDKRKQQYPTNPFFIFTDY